VLPSSFTPGPTITGASRPAMPANGWRAALSALPERSVDQLAKYRGEIA
jgi:hypothetical protein